MTTLDEVLQQLQIVQALVEDLPTRIQLAPQQVTIVSGLSDIDGSLGLVTAGEFRVGNGNDPGFGFSGVRMGYPAFTYGGADWHVAGVESDVIQFGLRATDGAALAGGGAVLLDASGITIEIGEQVWNKISWVDGADAVAYLYGYDDADNRIFIGEVFGSATQSPEIDLRITNDGDTASAASLTMIGGNVASVILSSGSNSEGVDGRTNLSADSATGEITFRLIGASSEAILGPTTGLPFTPDNLLHLWKASAGTVTANAKALLVVENSDDAYIHILHPAANEGGILFGDPTDNISGAILVDSSNNLLLRAGGNTTRFTLSSTGLDLTVPIYTESGTTGSVANGASETLFNAGNGEAWIVSVVADDGTSSTAIGLVVVETDGGAGTATPLSTNSITITNSGTGIRVTNNSGSAATFVWRALRLM